MDYATKSKKIISPGVLGSNQVLKGLGFYIVVKDDIRGNIANGGK